MTIIAYNPMTEERIFFPSKATCARHFKLAINSLNKYLEYGVPTLELADENNKHKIELVMDKMKGFDLFAKEEWDDKLIS